MGLFHGFMILRNGVKSNINVWRFIWLILLHVVETVKSMFRLPEEYVEELIEFAKSARGNAADIYQFTRQANEQMSRAQKLAILEAVWRVIYVDGKISKYEEHFARKLTNLLFLDHKDFIDAKLKARPAES